MGKEDFITIRVSKDEKRIIEKDAKEEERNVSNFLIWCWKQWRKNKKNK